jgi:hypothetical protein
MKDDPDHVLERFERYMEGLKRLVDELQDNEFECWISKESWNTKVQFKVTAPVLERTLK